MIKHEGQAPKVVRVDRYEFELDTGQVFQHLEPLDRDMTVDEFQVFYEHWYKRIKGDFA